MEARIALVTLLTDYVPGMVKFYREVLGFEVLSDLGEYVELKNDGVRFSICDRSIMLKATGDPSYLQAATGQAVELAFPCETPDAVDTAYQRAIEHGAKPVQPPSTMPWGQRTAFFGDPEGYIHEFFSDLPKQSSE